MSARRQFLAECGKAAAAFVLMACEQDKLLAPVCETVGIPRLDNPTVRDVYIVDGFTGSQDGTRDNPYSVRGASEFDALLSFLRPQDFLAVHKEGRFKTAGVYRWGQYASRNLGKGWTVDGDYELAIDPDSVTIHDAQPLYCLAGPASRVSGKVRGNHSSLADRWNGSLRTGGVLIDGNGSIEDVTFSDFGALGAETFVAEIVGSGNIVGNLFTEHDPGSTDNQVTVYRTMASENGERASNVLSVHERNTTYVPGSRLVQAHTIYQSPGLVRLNKSIGADVLYYGDYFQSRDVTIVENDATESIHGVQLRLSKTPLPEASNFCHERYVIGRNRFASSGVQVSLDTSGPTTDSRFIRDIEIHPSLTYENVGNGATDVRRGSECRRAA